MDNLAYHYKAGTNQLDHIREAVAAGVYTDSGSSSKKLFLQEKKMVPIVRIYMLNNIFFMFYSFKTLKVLR